MLIITGRRIMNSKNKTAEELTLFFVGGFLGAGVALLRAPQSGKKAR